MGPPKIQVKVRPQAHEGPKSASRLYVSREAFLQLAGNLDATTLCIVEKVVTAPAVTGSSAEGATSGGAWLVPAGAHGEFVIGPGSATPQPVARREATLWTQEKLGRGVVQMSRAFQSAMGLSIGDTVQITLPSPPTAPPEAVEVVLRETTDADGCEHLRAADAKDGDPLVLKARQRTLRNWEGYLDAQLAGAEYVFPGQVFENLFLFGPKRSFIVASVNGRADSIARFKHGYGRAKIASVDETNEVVRLPSPGRLHVPVSEIPGMEPVIRQLNDFFERFNEIERPPGLVGCGIVIEGAGGAGKTTILDRIAATGWGTIHRITTETKTTGIPLIFDLAIDGQPAIILIDNLPKIIGRSESAERHLVEGFRKLEALAENSQTFPKVVVVASCTNFTQDIPDSLQRSAAFCEFIVIPVPDSRAREEILQHTLGFRLLDDESTRLVRDIATRTHAFTVNDLKTLVRKAYLQAYGRKESPVRLRWDDWERARQQVRPSAMRGVYVKPPDVRWDDIGGQHGLKDLLIEELELHKLDPATVQRRGLRPAKGILMYGPPGCSKTLSAQALATESGFHFIPIKGAELLNMYVGETERGIRDLFKRASMVGPAIIFFDEIDSLASARHNKGVGHDGGGVNTVTTLLTEMDGFETLRGVVILAATNLPWRVDPALLRPGRFDRKVYVPPPDAADRAAIFRTLSRKLQQDAFSKLPSDWPERLAALTVDCSAAQVTDIFASANKMAFRRAPGTKEEKIAQMALTMEDLEACAKACRGSCTAEAVSPYLNFSREHSGDAG